jgi:hypothetical protein
MPPCMKGSAPPPGLLLKWESSWPVIGRLCYAEGAESQAPTTLGTELVRQSPALVSSIHSLKEGFLRLLSLRS